MPSTKLPPPADQAWPGDTDPDWDVVDEASWESFPASDPPGYYSVRVGNAPTQPAIDPARLRHRKTSWRARTAVAGLTLLFLGGLWILRRRSRA